MASFAAQYSQTPAHAPEALHQPRIVVIGVGGAGGNAVENMIQSKLEGPTFAVMNTDRQALEQSSAETKLVLGLKTTQGLGAGARPEVGKAAAEESFEEIKEILKGAHMVFITAGMGGGTGTGAAPIVARAAKEAGILTVGVVSKPFTFEGIKRARSADDGLSQLARNVDTLICIPNQNIFRLATEQTTLQDAFKMADGVLYDGVRGVTDLMIRPGMVNLDFNDVRTVMAEMGQAIMGAGEADGEGRAAKAAELAINSPLLDGISVTGARGVLINITGGPDMTLYEFDEAANRIREEVDPEANIIFGTAFDENMQNKIRVSVVATGLGREEEKPRMRTIQPVNGAATAQQQSFDMHSISGGLSGGMNGAEDPADFTQAYNRRQQAQRPAAENDETDWSEYEIPAFLRKQAN